MILPGICTNCRKVKRVRVTNAALVKMMAKGSHVPEGTCTDCQDKR